MSGSSFSNVCSWPRSWWYVVIPIDADSKSRAQVWKRTSLRWHGIAVCFEASSSSFPAIRVTACSTALASVQGSMRLLLTGPRYCNVLSTLLSLWPAFLHPLLPATVFVGCFGALPTSNAPLESLLKWKQGGTKTEELWFSDDFPSTHPLFQLKKWATVQNSCLILIPRPISKKTSEVLVVLLPILLVDLVLNRTIPGMELWPLFPKGSCIWILWIWKVATPQIG